MKNNPIFTGHTAEKRGSAVSSGAKGYRIKCGMTATKTCHTGKGRYDFVHERRIG